MRATVVLFGPSAVCASASSARAAPTAMPGCPCAHSSLADSSCHSVVSFCRVCSLHANSKTCVAGYYVHTLSFYRRQESEQPHQLYVSRHEQEAHLCCESGVCTLCCSWYTAPIAWCSCKALRAARAASANAAGTASGRCSTDSRDSRSASMGSCKWYRPPWPVCKSLVDVALAHSSLATHISAACFSVYPMLTSC